MPVEIDQIIRSRRKTLALIVQPDETLIVRSPSRISNISILDFIAGNPQWIERKQTQPRAAIPYEPKIGIASARTRWDSCSATGSLNFSWRLIQSPMDIVDYVAVHELMHTTTHNHSKRFWNRVEKILPDYVEHRRWLQKNGHLLLV